MREKFALFLLTLIVFSATSKAQVPAQWDTAKVQLTTKLNLVNNAIISKWDNQPYYTDFSSDLMLANSNRGYALFTPDPTYPYPIPAYQNALYAKIDTMLMAFDTIGLKAVDLTVLYPMLVNSFPNSEYYLDFYMKVAQKIKQKGFKLIIGCQASFVDETFGEPKMVSDILKHYYNPDGNPATDDTLELVRYKQEKLQMMQTIIDSLHPDYLTLETEPQTQEVNLFNLIDYNVDNTISLINFFTSNLNEGTTLIGAGAGTWDQIDFFEKIAQTNIDYIDYHIYPPHFNYIDNIAFKIDSIADIYNKKLVIGESWCYKATNSELVNSTNPVAISALIYSRDGFDYWESVDTLFVKSMILLSQQSKVELVQFHWAYVLFGQLTYNPAIYGSMTPAQQLKAAQNFGYQNMWQFNLSPTGLYTQNEIAKICNLTIGIHTLKNLTNIFLSPNPATNQINITSESPILGKYIYDLTGNLVYSSNNQTKTIILSENFNTGMYIVKVQTEKGEYSNKIVIDK
jgi:hypothetical protein